MVRKIIPAVLISFTCLWGFTAQAQTLEEALVQAYDMNPVLNGARAQLRAVDERVPQAKAGYRPRVDAEGSIGRAWTDTNVSGSDTRDPANVGVTVTQPIYRGGRTVAAVGQSKNLVQAQRAALQSTEQDVLLSGVTAYLDVVRDQSVVTLNVNNEQVLRRQYRAERDRFDAGAATRTDVSQAESRLARATADRIAAEGNLESSRAIYARVFGTLPGELKQPEMQRTLPASLDETIDLATHKNPDVIAASYTELAAHDTVDVVRGELLPEANLVGNASRNWETSRDIDRADSTSVVAQLRIPLYEAGGVTARVREAKHTANQRRIDVEQARRVAQQTAVQAWQAWTSAQAEIKSRQSQIKAAQIALDSTREQAKVGTRTTLDVLDAEQELLDARANMIQAERNRDVASFQVLSAVGQLTAPALGLAVKAYDPVTHYEEVEDAWWGTGVEDYDKAPSER